MRTRIGKFPRKAGKQELEDLYGVGVCGAGRALKASIQVADQGNRCDASCRHGQVRGRFGWETGLSVANALMTFFFGT